VSSTFPSSNASGPTARKLQRAVLRAPKPEMIKRESICLFTPIVVSAALFILAIRLTPRRTADAFSRCATTASSNRSLCAAQC
jgi:hypothetical protein